MWLIGWIIAGATVVGLAIVIAFSINNTSTLHNEKVTACIESGGTWVDYGNLCIAADKNAAEVG